MRQSSKVVIEKRGRDVLGTVGLIFIVLKLIGLINWSWWWVLAPFWLIPVFWVSVWMFIFMAALIVTVMAGK